MPERCVVDTSALQYLFRIGQLDILQTLFDEVLVADAVEQELNRGKSIGYIGSEYNGLFLDHRCKP